MAARELPLSVRDLTISPAELRATLGYGTAEPGPDVQEIVDRLTARALDMAEIAKLDLGHSEIVNHDDPGFAKMLHSLKIHS